MYKAGWCAQHRACVAGYCVGRVSSNSGLSERGCTMGDGFPAGKPVGAPQSRQAGVAGHERLGCRRVLVGRPGGLGHRVLWQAEEKSLVWHRSIPSLLATQMRWIDHFDAVGFGRTSFR